MSSKKSFFFFCMYKMYLISAEGYKNAEVDAKIVRKTGEIWASMKNVQDVKNMSDLIFKETSGIYETKNLTKEQTKNYKMTERKFFEKFDKLSEDKLNAKSNQNVYVRNDVITTVIKRRRGEEKNRRKKNRWIQKKVDDSRI